MDSRTQDPGSSDGRSDGESPPNNVLSEPLTEPGARRGEPLVEPTRMLHTGLEIDQTGPALWSAVDRGLASDRPSVLLRILHEAPEGSRVADKVWRRVANLDTVARILGEPDPDFEALDLLTARLGTEAAAPLLERLAISRSRSVRRQLYARLVALGSAIGPDVVPWLDDARWYVRRNMLVLLGELEQLPRRWSPARYVDDPHPGVRREALKLMLRLPESHDAAVRGLLEDDDPRSLALGLAAAHEGVPAETIPFLVRLAESRSEREELRAAAVELLGQVRDQAATTALCGLVGGGSRGVRRLVGRPLAEKSAVMLAALEGLRASGTEDPRARKLLAIAGRSRDPEVRVAALGEESR